MPRSRAKKPSSPSPQPSTTKRGSSEPEPAGYRERLRLLQQATPHTNPDLYLAREAVHKADRNATLNRKQRRSQERSVKLQAASHPQESAVDRESFSRATLHHSLTTCVRMDPCLERALLRVKDEEDPILALRREQASQYVEFVMRRLREQNKPTHFFIRRIEWTRDPIAVAQLRLNNENHDRYPEMDVMNMHIYVKTVPVDSRDYDARKSWHILVNRDGQRMGVMVWWRITHLKKFMMVSEETIGPDQFGEQLAQVLLSHDNGLMIVTERLQQMDPDRPIALFPDASILCDSDLLKIAREGANQSGDREGYSRYTEELRAWKHPLSLLVSEKQRKYEQNQTPAMALVRKANKWQEIRAYIEKINQLIDRDLLMLRPIASAFHAMFPNCAHPMQTPWMGEESLLTLEPPPSLVQQFLSQLRETPRSVLLSDEALQKEATLMARNHVGLKDRDMLAAEVRRNHLGRQLELERALLARLRDEAALADDVVYAMKQRVDGDMVAQAWVALHESFANKRDEDLKRDARRALVRAGMDRTMADFLAWEDVEADASGDVEAQMRERERRRLDPLQWEGASEVASTYVQAQMTLQEARRMVEATEMREQTLVESMR
jgi:hypothetical protein